MRRAERSTPAFPWRSLDRCLTISSNLISPPRSGSLAAAAARRRCQARCATGSCARRRRGPRGISLASAVGARDRGRGCRAGRRRDGVLVGSRRRPRPDGATASSRRSPGRSRCRRVRTGSRSTCRPERSVRTAVRADGGDRSGSVRLVQRTGHAAAAAGNSGSDRRGHTPRRFALRRTHAAAPGRGVRGRGRLRPRLAARDRSRDRRPLTAATSPCSSRTCGPTAAS